ncbi:MAG: ATP-binding protein [Bacteroidales bacterium]|nr:ATP-binding protein [Bacteroidales bacterium]
MTENRFSTIKYQEIISAYFEYFYSYTNRNWQAMVGRIAKDFTMFGTGIDEIGLSKEETLLFFTREFEQSPTPIEFEIKELKVFKINEELAYLMILMDMKISMPNDEIRKCPNNRTTAIMAYEEGEWKLHHGHWSQPAEGQEIGESIPYKLLKVKNKELEEKVRERTKEIEKQNIELHKLNKTKTDLLSIISHDLRSPFNAFMGLTDIMLLNFNENIKEPEYFRKQIELINERATNLFNVADTLLNWAWSQTEEIVVKKERINLEIIINNQINILKDIAQSKDVEIEILSKEEINFNTDPKILGIIIRNLISNSIKYSHKGKSITIDYFAKGTNVVIEISDSGVGMDNDKIREILASNINTSTLGTQEEKGTGLGLNICKSLIDKIGGRFFISSKKNKGTSVTIYIPKK